jgi:hypothetical protein
MSKLWDAIYNVLVQFEDPHIYHKEMIFPMEKGCCGAAAANTFAFGDFADFYTITAGKNYTYNMRSQGQGKDRKIVMNFILRGTSLFFTFKTIEQHHIDAMITLMKTVKTI